MQESLIVDSFKGLFPVFVVAHENISSPVANFPYISVSLPSLSLGSALTILSSVPTKLVPAYLIKFLSSRLNRLAEDMVYGPPDSDIP